jgi:phage terminase large subunit-like protein
MKQNYYYDEAKAEKAVNFIEKYCTHVKGDLGGKPFILEDWQKDDIIRPIFGWMREDGRRKYRTAYIEVPRKNGKSNLCSAIALYMLCSDGERGAEVISAAGDRSQARIVFDIAKGMCDQNPVLDRKLDARQYAIAYGTSTYKAISAEAGTKHGLNCHAVIFDELHTQPNPDLWNVLVSSVGSRSQPLVIAITTAGYDVNSICFEQHEYARQVKEGSIVDETFLPVIYAASIEDDWTKEETWKKANPGYGTICRKEYFETEVAKCKANPRQLNTFLRLHLNIWTSSSESWISDDEFMKGAQPFDESQLAGLPCYIGLDLSSVRDLTAVAAIWVDEEAETYYLKCHQFVNEDTARDRSLSGGVDYYMFEKLGFLSVTPGNVTDISAVERRVLDLCENNEVKMVAYDRWNAVQIIPSLIEKEIPTEPFGQGYKSMSYPTKQMEVLILAGRFLHGGHDVLRWQFGCVKIQTDEADNKKVSKKKNVQGQMVDGVVASIMALGCYYNNKDESETSYDIVSL